jgi:riboflavin transporter FmnP
MSSKKQIFSVRQLTMTAILAAISTILMFLNFSIPLMPSFIKLDFSELPALIAAFSMGPVSGIAVCLIKNLINLLQSGTGGIGELSNFLLGISFVVPAGLIYKIKKTKTFAIIGAFTGAVIMALMSFPINLFIVFPIYIKLFFNGDSGALLSMYQAILPSVGSISQCLIIFHIPFTFLKALISVIITIFAYKHLSPIIKGKKIT